MAARFCDGACKCAECSHYKNDKERHGKACVAVPDNTGIVHAAKKQKGNHDNGTKQKYQN